MCGAECIVYEDLGHGSQFTGECGIVLLLFLVEANVLDHHNLTGLQSGSLRLGILADNVGSHNNLLTQKLAQTGSNGSQRIFHVELTLGTTHVRAEDNGSVFLHQVLDSGQSAVDTGLIGDYTVRHGNVEVAANENFFAGYGNVFDIFLVVCHMNLLM